eukprot:comp12439_c0_seq1/m.7356 comp12439_c0_seq1/g.7356  ORF comp12439_c0_seq1/g.7356 comp12439_c0_seq1/m.7356 type:complete len:238 (-) comp12439_c0_seq1:196-909(-)
MGVDTEKLKATIKSVLKGKDFGNVSVKKARSWVEEELGVDLTEQKDEFKDLCVEAMSELQEEQQSSSESSAEDDPPKKKRGRPSTKGKDKALKKKREASDDDDDEDFDGQDDEDIARNLHSELNSSGRRGKKEKKVKRSKKDTGDKPKRTTGLNAPQILSDQLSALMGGQPEMPRTEVVKQLWVLIRERGLQDPNNKRTIMCDKDFQSVFGCEQMDMFKMNKLLSNHLRSKADIVAQ